MNVDWHDGVALYMLWVLVLTAVLFSGSYTLATLSDVELFGGDDPNLIGAGENFSNTIGNEGFVVPAGVWSDARDAVTGQWASVAGVTGMENR